MLSANVWPTCKRLNMLEAAGMILIGSLFIAFVLLMCNIAYGIWRWLQDAKRQERDGWL